MDSDLAKCVENVIKVGQNLAFGYLGDIVHTFARIIPYSGILIGETSQDWRHNLVQIAG